MREEDRQTVFDGEGEMEFPSCITYLALGAGAGVLVHVGMQATRRGRLFKVKTTARSAEPHQLESNLEGKF